MEDSHLPDNERIAATAPLDTSHFEKPAAAAALSESLPVSSLYTVPDAPLARTAFAVLDKHCARCHQVGRLEGRQKPSKGLGNILNLKQIAADPKLVQPGRPEHSSIYFLMKRGEMPYDVVQDPDDTHEAPTEADKTAVRDWILSLPADTQTASNRTP